ncbi:MAG: ATP-binding cassette domain-containing protein [Acidimicrobiales bacterium]|nr:ATP-binding cassette domain-containing protein [Acidimicrobiales bacterium]
MAGSGTAHLRDDPNVILRVENLVVEFPAGRGRTVHAVSDVSFDVAEGETLGLVGESGCGKSTTAKAVIQMPRPTSGVVEFQGQNLAELRGEAMRQVRPNIQMIFQDPIASLNPRQKVRDVVAEGLEVWGSRGAFSESRVDEMLEAVGLDPRVAGERQPHEFSGGQCQRISVARALVLDPKVIICDEPVSALDVSVQAQILNMLEDMKERYGVTLLFISHDLSVVKNISDRVMVMYLGKVCEVAPSDDLYEAPAHPYTRALLGAIPGADNPMAVHAETLDDELPSPINPPSGCRFHTRCPRATDECKTIEPVMEKVDEGHYVACHHPFIDD